MRRQFFILIAGLFAGPALAGRAHIDEFEWVDGPQTLALHGDGDRVVVTQATPSPLRGLQVGDVLASVDDRAVHDTAALEQAVRNAHGHSVRVQVAHDGVLRTLTWTARDYSLFLPPPPPSPPPAPPPPPAPGN
jgi:hypothetical protein